MSPPSMMTQRPQFPARPMTCGHEHLQVQVNGLKSELQVTPQLTQGESSFFLFYFVFVCWLYLVFLLNFVLFWEGDCKGGGWSGGGGWVGLGYIM